ncbi:DUF4157 domain-containing protein [Algoriphagus sp.]|uniref:eCIS core domain-containing protein n=1 Tax=Algoriphagus sp. TaxID=1872435 RepID=UPI0026002847|nr:DUF4157 domain-containing protein [Algoriphagus sp.]
MHEPLKHEKSNSSPKGKLRVSFFSPSKVQPKLKVNHPNDSYEKEADAVADQVISARERKGLISQNVNTPKIQSKENDTTKSQADTIPPTVKNTLNKGGEPLDNGVRESMESAFGQDFSKVRIHSDGIAHQSADDINARAYTFQNNIVFGNNQYNPESFEGKKLLAHELVHTIQQGNTENSGIEEIQRSVKTFIEGGIRGHASPRWENTGRSTSEELNLTLSRDRANNVEYLFQEMFRRYMAGHGEVEFAIESSISGEREEGVVSLPAEGVGDRETLVEGGGDVDANDPSMRRVDIDIVVTRQEEGMAPSTESIVIPEECEANATNQWSIKMTVGGGGGHAGLGGAFAIGKLKNRRTGQIAEGSFIGGGIGVGLQTPGADPGWGDWTDFVTDDICTFDDFNFTLARLTTAGAGAYVGYSLAWISFPLRGANSIYVGGFNVGAVGADAGSNVGEWNIHGTPPGPRCVPEHESEREVFTPFQFDIQDGLRHTVFFETGSSEINDEQFRALDSFVQQITARYSED